MNDSEYIAYYPEPAIQDILLDAGVAPADCETITRELDALVDSIATKRAAILIRHLLADLDDCAAGIALRRIVLGAGEKTLREEAESIGKSHQAILKAEKVARRRLGLPKTD